MKSVSQNSGGEKGNRIEIEGSGFGSIAENIHVSVGTLSCTVKEASNNKIICDLEEGVTEPASPGQF